MPVPPVSIDGIHIPAFLYGTAWKEEDTQRLTELALQQGFRGIDTANQRRHYYEAAVGRAIAASIQRGLISRDDLFLQTKFTFRESQDDRLPYDARASIPIQVEQSFASSLEHLGTRTLDAYLLHGPSQRTGLGVSDWEAWRAMELIYDSGQTRTLGVSNVTVEQLRLLCDKARIPPRFVQNRCYAVKGWDRQVRRYCAENRLIYQGFSLLTANREVLRHHELERIALRYGRTVNQIVFRFAIDLGLLPLTGTSNAEHMRDDLAVLEFRLKAEEVSRIESIAMR